MTQHVIDIQAGKVVGRYLDDLWRYRELALFMAWRDVLVRYKQTAIGVLWVVLRPLLMAVAFVFVFSKVAGLSSGPVPYLLFVLAGMLPWQFFASAVAVCSESVTGNAGMVTKIYFPRLLLPVSAMLSTLLDFLVTLPLLAAVMVWYGVAPGPQLPLALVFLILIALLAVGLGSLLAALNVFYRDFRYVVPFLVQFGLYVSPVGFGLHAVPEQWRLLYCLNPMAGLLDGLRWALLDTPLLVPPAGMALSVVICLLVFAFGVRSFIRMERDFVDVI